MEGPTNIGRIARELETSVEKYFGYSTPIPKQIKCKLVDDIQTESKDVHTTIFDDTINPAATIYRQVAASFCGLINLPFVTEQVQDTLRYE